MGYERTGRPRQFDVCLRSSLASAICNAQVLHGRTTDYQFMGTTGASDRLGRCLRTDRDPCVLDGAAARARAWLALASRALAIEAAVLPLMPPNT